MAWSSSRFVSGYNKQIKTRHHGGLYWAPDWASVQIRIRMFTGDTSNDIHSPGPVIWEVSP